jgi:hypothetical protein
MMARRRPTLDEILLEEATIYGPVVAVGNPTDQHPPYGAARAYLNDKDWQEVVAELANDAVAIVICIDNTDGIWWEIGHLYDNAHISKTLFLFHPRLTKDGINTEVAVGVLEKIGFAAVATELRSQTMTSWRKANLGCSIFGIFVDTDTEGGVKVVHSSTFSRVAALIILRWFLRSKFGAKPIVPIQHTRNVAANLSLLY